MVSLGQKIRQRRLEKKMTQTQLAEGLVSASAISQIESDKINPSYKLLCKIAERLEVPLDFFLSEEEEYLEHSTSHKLAKTFLMAKEYQQAVPILEKLHHSSAVSNTELMLDLATCYIQLNNFSPAHELLEQVMNISLKEDDNNAYVNSLNKMGLLYFKQNNTSLSIHYWHKAYDMYREIETFDPFDKAYVCTNLAIAFNRIGKFDESARLFTESQELVEGTVNLHLLASNYMGLGVSHYGKKEYKIAEEYCQEAISIYKNLDQIRYSITVKENFAIMKGEAGETDEALKLLFECLNEFEEHDLKTRTANTHGEIAKLLIKESRFDEARTHIETAFQCCEPDTIYHAECYFVRSLLLVAEGHYQEAIPDARKAINLYLEIESIHEYNMACLHLSDIFKKLEDYKSATEILEEAQHALQIYLREKGVIL
ncbi:MAG: tetratricopeptide repeat protein [Tumebacillaceae bacterium]